MSLSPQALMNLGVALASFEAAAEINSLLTSDGSSATPTFTTVTTTANAFVGADLHVTGNAYLGASQGLIIGANQVVGAQQTKVTPVVVTFTASAPSNYASPTGALTIANGGTPTVVELVEYCDELRANIVALQAVLHAHGLTT